MKNPTSNGNDLYQIGNDYPQVADKYFVASSYRDGIYTELKDDNGFNSVKSSLYSALSGDVFWNLKDLNGLNKRVLDVLPQDDWKPFSGDNASALSGDLYLSDDYATGIVSGDLGETV